MCGSKPQSSVTWTGEGNIPDADGRFDNAPYFNFNDDKLKFDTNDVDNANDNYGSASGFSPKSLLKTERRILYQGTPLVFFRRLDPSADHSADFIDNGFQPYVFLFINSFHIFC